MLKNQLKLIGLILSFTTTLAFANPTLVQDPKDTFSQKSSHLLVEYNGCNDYKLNDGKYLKELLIQAAIVGKFTVLKTTFHQFEPQGVTGILLLSESHMSIHTWPEHGYAAVDLFTCGKNSTSDSEALIKKSLECKHSEKMLIKRGYGIQYE